MDLHYLLRRGLARAPLLLGALILGTAGGLILALGLPPVYVARAVMIVESQQIPADLAETTVQVEASEQLQIIEQRLLARDRLLDMDRRLGIGAGARDGEAAPSAETVVEDLRRRIAMTTTGGSVPRGPVQATVVTVSFEAETPEMAARVANDLVTRILDENIRLRTDVASETLAFFTEEVERLDRELVARGAEILAFQEANLEALPDSLDFRRRAQAAAQERLGLIEREAAQLRDRRARMEALYAATGLVPAAPGSRAESAQERRIAELREELASAASVLSPQNPRVRLLATQLAALEGGVAPDPGLTEIPVPDLPSAYALELSDLDAQLGFLAAEAEEIGRSMAGLAASIEATPANAITLDMLERDHDNLRAQYDQAVVNRARAQTGDMIEALAKGQRITVIEEAVAPEDPDRPDRRLITLGGVAAGLVLGLGLIALLEAADGSVRRPADLARGLGIEPYATLPVIETRAERRRRHLGLAMAGALVVAVLLLGAGLALGPGLAAAPGPAGGEMRP